MLKAILFDLDGTLVDSLPLHLQAYDYALRTLGIEAPRDEIIAKCFNKVDEVAAANFGIGDVASFAEPYHAKIQELLPQAKPHEGIPELLQWLVTEPQIQPIQLGIGTMRIETELGEVLRALHWEHSVAAAVTGDQVTRPKPHPETFLKLLDTLMVATSQALIVGDASTDILAGQAAGIPVALFLPPSHVDFYSFDELKALKPTFVFEQPMQLERIIKELQGESEAV